jgi:hypothetical protein
MGLYKGFLGIPTDREHMVSICPRFYLCTSKGTLSWACATRFALCDGMGTRVQWGGGSGRREDKDTECGD